MAPPGVSLGPERIPLGSAARQSQGPAERSDRNSGRSGFREGDLYIPSQLKFVYTRPMRQPPPGATIVREHMRPLPHRRRGSRLSGWYVQPRKDVAIPPRLSAQEKADFAAAAIQDHVSLSEWLRIAAHRHLRRGRP